MKKIFILWTVIFILFSISCSKPPVEFPNGMTVEQVEQDVLDEQMKVLTSLLEAYPEIQHGLKNLHERTWLFLGLPHKAWQSLEEEKRLSLICELSATLNNLTTSRLSDLDREKLIRGEFRLPEDGHWIICLGSFKDGEFIYDETVAMGVYIDYDSSDDESLIKAHEYCNHLRATHLEIKYLVNHDPVLEGLLEKTDSVYLNLRPSEKRSILLLGMTGETWNALTDNQRTILCLELKEKAKQLKMSELSDENREDVLTGKLSMPTENEWIISIGKFERGSFYPGEIKAAGMLYLDSEMMRESYRKAYLYYKKLYGENVGSCQL